MKSVSDVPGRAIIFAALDPAIKNGLAENRTNIILRQLESAGLAIVPKEATPEMIHAATLKFMRENGGLDASISEVWTAMVAASHLT